MKNLVFIGFLMVATALGGYAQKGKIGHINSNDLLILMPERDSAEAKLKDFAQQLELQLTSMSGEYEKKLTDYEQNKDVMTDIIRQEKETEIVDLQRRIQDFQGRAQQELQKKEQELMKPLVDKANGAIKSVANENGYAYIFDTSVGVVLHYPDGDDILPLVKKKLGIN